MAAAVGAGHGTSNDKRGINTLVTLAQAHLAIGAASAAWLAITGGTYVATAFGELVSLQPSRAHNSDRSGMSLMSGAMPLTSAWSEATCSCPLSYGRADR